jgi:hypothetical protein
MDKRAKIIDSVVLITPSGVQHNYILQVLPAFLTSPKFLTVWSVIV